MQTPSASPNDPTAFLEHAAYLRRLARGLLGDPGAAEDLVQEAWLASLKAQPRAGVPLRAWLAGWVRNRSLQQRREDGRRAHREQAAARPDRQSPETETSERLEVLQFVLRTVESLDEPYRTVIRLRFLDDLSTREVAGRLGIPVNTVRSRLRRGLAQVRGMLDANCPGGRGSLLSALVPLAGSLPTAAGAATSTWLGAFFMQSKFTFAALSVFLIGFSWFGWRMAQPKDSRPLGGVEQEEPESIAVSSDRTSSEPETMVTSVPGALKRAAVESSLNWTLRGTTFLRRGGEPFPGARVRLRIFGEDYSPGEQDPHNEVGAFVDVELVSDDAGGLRWSGPRPATNCWIELVGLEPDHSAFPSLSWVPTESTAPELKVWLLPFDLLVTGMVRDEEGNGIAGARVSQARIHTTCATDGSFELAIPAADGEIHVEAMAVGFSQGSAVVRPTSGKTTNQVDFTLRKEFVIAGRVVDANGNPLEGANVDAFYLRGDGVMTASDGKYELRGLDPGRPEHMVTARKSGYVLKTVDVPANGAQREELNFELSRGVRVLGRVLDAAREPVAGAKLYIGFSPHAYDRLDALADPEGRFAFESVGRGIHTLVTQAAGLASTRMELVVPDDGDVLAGVDVSMSAGQFLAGVVVNEEGEPVAGLQLSALHLGEYNDAHGETDPQGRFRLESLPEAGVGVEVYGGEYLRLSQDIEELGVEDLRLVVKWAGSLAGTVVDGRTGEPVPSFRIRMVYAAREEGDTGLSGFDATWMREGFLFDREDGTWDTGKEDLHIGHVIGIEVQAAGYASAVHPRAVVQREPDPRACVIELSPGTRLHGVVTLASSGLALQGVRIKRFSAKQPLRDGDGDDVHRRVQTMTDQEGAYEFGDLAAGEIYLALMHPDIGRITVGPIELDLGASDLEYNIAVSIDGAIAGELLDGEGQPIAGGTVALRPVGIPGYTSDQDRRVQAAGDGRFRFDKLVDGDYEVAHEWVFSSGHFLRHHTHKVTIEQGRVVDLDLAPLGDASLTGRIEASPTLPEEVAVWLTRTHAADGAELRSGAEQQFGAIARDGVFQFQGLLPGTYRVWPNYFDRETRRSVSGKLNVQIAAGSDGECVVALAPQD